jgi:hypothetical protein
MNRNLVSLLLVAGLVPLAPRNARATLAGDLASVTSNERALEARRTVVALTGVTRHDLTLPSGDVVQEFVSPAGVVFAIRWRGPSAPNLRELLGRQFDKLRTKRSRGWNHTLSSSAGDFEIRAWNHRHLFGGAAWIPSLVPAGSGPRSWEEP